MAKTEIVGYEQRLICGVLRRCPVIREVSEEYVPQYSLYGRMGWDSDPMCLHTNLSAAQVALKIEHYLATWRHVEVRREL